MSVERLLSIQSEIKELLRDNSNLKYFPKIIIVCKTFPMYKILPLIQYGHIHFAENKLQEAWDKWKDIKKQFPQIKLHMVGKLQSNKVRKAIELFDYVHSVDNYKLAKKISKYQNILKKHIEIFVQVNVGEESHKNGIYPKQTIQFVNTCRNDLSLNVLGLMCLPPKSRPVEKYFMILRGLKKITQLNHLSMGMSDDYKIAIKHESTFLRIGSKIFGDRLKI